MKTCYVSIPYGRRSDSLGRSIDFDRIYQDAIRPAVEAEGVQALHGADLDAGAVFHKALFRTILAADVFIADLTIGNPNVMYELGLRHASRRSVTILVMAAGATVPFNVNLVRVLLYELDADGALASEGAARFQESLRRQVREGLRHVSNDSPLYDFFPDLEVTLPAGLGPAAPRRAPLVRSSPGPGHGTGMGGPSRSISGDLSLGTGTGSGAPLADPEARLREGEEALRGAPDADPFGYITLMRRYRDESAWGEVIRVADSLPPEVERAPEVLQMLSLALNRRRDPGDQERAIEVIQSLIEETGGDGESFGVLGRIFKDRWHAHRASGDDDAAAEDLDRAIEAYRRGFEREPGNFYPGINLATLLLLRGAPADRDELREVAPRVRSALDAKTTPGRADYWQTATRLELEVLSGEWDRADELAEQVATAAEAPWMVESTRGQLQLLLPAVASGADHDRLSAIVERLGAAATPGGEVYA